MKKLLFSLVAVLLASTAWAGEVVFTAGTDIGDIYGTAGTITIEKEGVKIVISSGASMPQHYRMYKNSTTTVSSEAGAITKVVFECTTQGTAQYGPGNFSATPGEYYYSENLGIWTGENESVVFTAVTSQVRATKITVTTLDENPTDKLDLTGEIILGDVDENGNVSVSYTGEEDVTINVTVDGIFVEVNDGQFNLGSYGYHRVAVTVNADGYNSLGLIKDYDYAKPVTEQTGAPYFNLYSTEGIHAYFLEIISTEPSAIYYRVQHEWGEFSEWNEYEDVLSFTQNGWYRVEAYAVADDKLPSPQIAYEFELKEEPAPEVTDMPVINYDEETFTVTVEGAGEIHAYVDGVEVQLPYTFEQGETDVTYVVTATAQEQGKEISEIAERVITVPAKVVVPQVTDMPVINYDEQTFTVTVEGAGEIHAYVDGVEVQLPYTFEQDETDVTYVVTATAQEQGKEISETAERIITVPAKVVVPENPHMTGYWLVEINARGEKIYTELFPGQNGDYVNVDDVTYPEFYDVCPFYFMIDGVAYGAAEDMTLANLGDADQNPLTPNENAYYVSVGYSYTFGIHFIYDVNTMEFKGYSAYVAQGGNVDVDEVAAVKSVAGVRYFNLAGQEMQEANGLTIVVTTYTDGTTSAVKVMK